MTQNNETHSGMVALVGAPNAGKSTLLNALVGQKLGIITHKVQTTRRNVRGIWTEGETQVVFIDTPGLLSERPKRSLEQAMIQQYEVALNDADIVLVVVDAVVAAKRLQHGGEVFPQLPEHRAAQTILVLNKMDLVKPRSAVLPLMEAAQQTADFDAVFAISALKESGLKDLQAKLLQAMPVGPFLFDTEQVTDLRSRDLAAEITREQALLQLHDEVPYDLAVETLQFIEKEDGSIHIDQNIVIARDSQKRIVVGERGSKIKAIGSKARAEIGKALDTKVHLFLKVKVRPRWAEDPRFLSEQGL